MHRFVVRVRYAESDPMGFAYYAHYLRWFEIGRVELLRSLGMSYQAVEETGIRLPVLEVRCRYLRPARYDDALRIETGVSDLGRASVRFGYRVVRDADGELLARGETRHCFLDREGRPRRPPGRLARLLREAPPATDVAWVDGAEG